MVWMSESTASSARVYTPIAPEFGTIGRRYFHRGRTSAARRIEIRQNRAINHMCLQAKRPPLPASRAVDRAPVPWSIRNPVASVNQEPSVRISRPRYVPAGSLLSSVHQQHLPRGGVLPARKPVEIHPVRKIAAVELQDMPTSRLHRSLHGGDLLPQHIKDLQ